jgi:hypothetical protein
MFSAVLPYLYETAVWLSCSQGLLVHRAMEAGDDLAGRSKTAICKEERHVQADQLQVGSIHFAFDSFAERQRDGPV